MAATALKVKPAFIVSVGDNMYESEQTYLPLRINDNMYGY